MVKVIGGNAVVAYGVLQLTKVVKSFQLFKRELLVRSFVRLGRGATMQKERTPYVSFRY